MPGDLGDSSSERSAQFALWFIFESPDAHRAGAVRKELTIDLRRNRPCDVVHESVKIGFCYLLAPCQSEGSTKPAWILAVLRLDSYYQFGITPSEMGCNEVTIEHQHIV